MGTDGETRRTAWLRSRREGPREGVNLELTINDGGEQVLPRMLCHEIHPALDVEVNADARADLNRRRYEVYGVETPAQDLPHERRGARGESFWRKKSDGAHVAGLSAALWEEYWPEPESAPPSLVLSPPAQAGRTSVQQLHLPLVWDFVHRGSFPLLSLDDWSRRSLVAASNFGRQRRQQRVALTGEKPDKGLAGDGERVAKVGGRSRGGHARTEEEGERSSSRESKSGVPGQLQRRLLWCVIVYWQVDEKG